MSVADLLVYAADLHLCAVPDWNQDESATLLDVGAV